MGFKSKAWLLATMLSAVDARQRKAPRKTIFERRGAEVPQHDAKIEKSTPKGIPNVGFFDPKTDLRHPRVD